MKEPRVVLADNAGLFTLDGTRTFLIGNDQVVIIDPGPGDLRHLERVSRLVEGAREGSILLTHGHADHAQGAPELARQTGFEVLGGVPGVDRPLQDGDRIRVDGGWIVAVSTPGHARGHIAYFDSRSDDLFVGDLLLGKGSTTWVGEYAGCMRDYLDSLERVEALEPKRIFPAHGPVLEHPREAIRAFRSHREERIRQVERALGTMSLEVAATAPVGAGSDTNALVELLVDHVYGPELPTKAREGARWSVRATLEYLGAAPFPAKGAPTEGGNRLAGGD